MTDDKSAADSKSDDSKGSDGGSQTDSVDSLKAQIEKLEADVSKFEARSKEVIADRNNLKRKLQDIEQEKHAKDGNIEELRKGWEAERKELLDSKTAAETRLKRVTVEKSIKEVAAEHVLPSALEDFWRLHADLFELGDDDRPRVKDSVKPVRDFVRGLVEAKPHFAKNPRKPGSGDASAGGDKSGKSGVTVDDLDRMTREERIKALREDKSLLTEFEKRRARR